MKRFLIAAIALLILFPKPVLAETEKAQMSEFAGSGEAILWDGPLSEAGFYDPRGIDAGEDGTLWVWDGLSLRRIRDGKVETVASLWDLEDELEPYGLNSTQAIASFNLATIEEFKGDVYISGLMFRRDREVLWSSTDDLYRMYRMGYAYNVLLRYHDGKLDIMDITFAAERQWDDRWVIAFGEEAGAMQGNLYNYHYMLLWPRFIIHDDGTIYMVRRHDHHDEQNSYLSTSVSVPVYEIVRFKGEDETVIYRDIHYGLPSFHDPRPFEDRKGWQQHIAVVSEDETRATIYTGQRGLVFNIDLTQPLATDTDDREAVGVLNVTNTGIYVASHPRYYKGVLYFLSPRGIWRPMLDGAWGEDVLLEEDVLGMGEDALSIPDWTIGPDGTIFVIDYNSRKIMKITNTPFSKAKEGWNILLPGYQAHVTTPVVNSDGELWIPLKPVAEEFLATIQQQNGQVYLFTHTLGRRIPVTSAKLIDGEYYARLSELQKIWSEKMWPPHKIDWDEAGKNLVFTPIIEGFPDK